MQESKSSVCTKTQETSLYTWINRDQAFYIYGMCGFK